MKTKTKPATKASAIEQVKHFVGVAQNLQADLDRITASVTPPLVPNLALSVEPRTDPTTRDVLRDHNSHVVCVYARAVARTHFLAIDGPQLTTCSLPHDEFNKTYDTPTGHCQADFARTWTKDPSAISMVPISGSALRVLKAILAGQTVNADEPDSSLANLENHMAATEETGFRKPDGPVAKVHAHLDKHIDKIKAGTISRKELIDAMVAKGMSSGTATTQAGVWARNNGVAFARPAAAVGAKTEAKAKAAKKSAKAKKTAAN